MISFSSSVVQGWSKLINFLTGLDVEQLPKNADPYLIILDPENVQLPNLELLRILLRIRLHDTSNNFAKLFIEMLFWFEKAML